VPPAVPRLAAATLAGARRPAADRARRAQRAADPPPRPAGRHAAHGPQPHRPRAHPRAPL
ncbi:MAG: hypothetical protein AVDCRST_MAG38-607, partial [uncultured Solirubrobacteraceae bacterium]